MEMPETSPIPRTSMPVRSRGRLSAFATGALAAVAMLLGAQDALARPANPKPLIRVQPDGTEVRIRALGDERVVFYEDEEGYTVLREADGWWRYADPRSHKAEKLVATRLAVGHDRMPEGSQKHVRPKVDPRTFHIEWDQKNDGTIAELFRKWREGSRSNGRSMAALGTSAPLGVPLLVIPIEFSDWQHTSGPGTPRTWEPDYNPNVTMPGNTAAAWEDLFGDPTVPGGLNHYYNEVSYGQFQWQVAVAKCDPANGAHPTATCNGGWYRNANTMAYWGGDTGSAAACTNDAAHNIRDLIEWAIKAAEPDVNYALYDTNGNGQISDAELMVLVVHARDGQENYGDGCGSNAGDPANDHIWSHKWNIDTAVSVDGKTFPVGKTYSINPEFEPGLVWNASRSYYDVVDKWFGVGVYAHESFHTLGAPDLYDYGYDANVAGEWDLMDAGSFNGAKSGTHPSHMGSPLKQDINLNSAGAYGWIFDTEMVKVHSEGAKAQSIDALSGPNATNVMHQLVMPADATEWIVLENRAPVGYYEPWLPEHGILAWHRDTTGGRDAWPYAANVLRKGWANTATGLNTPTAGAAFSLEDGETALTSTSDPSNRTNSGTVSNLLDVKCIGAEGTRMPYVYGSISGANPGFGGATVSGGTDSDPWLDNGETATLTVSVYNSSCAGTAATGVEITLDVVAGGSIDPSAVTITPATVSLGNVAAGASANAVFSVSLACDDPALYAGKSLELAFTITATNVALPVTGTFSKDVQRDYAVFDDAESGGAGWSSTQPFNPSVTTCTPAAAGHGGWAWQNPTDRRRSGTRAFHTPETTTTSNLAFTNPSEVWVSPSFTVPSGAKQLRFWSAASIPAAGYTRARVWVSADGGANWTRLNWYKDGGDVAAWEEVVYDLEGFDAATQLKLLFTMYTYGCWPTGTASAEGWYVDDVAIVVDEQDACDACTTPPGTPTITSVTDADACAVSGVRVSYTAGSGATSHDLLKDGVLAVSGYASGALYVPGDGTSHAYVVRANKAGCPSADSAPSSFADGNASLPPPATLSVSDVDACTQSGVTVTWSAVAGATSYDLLVDATPVSGVTSPYSYNPGDSSSHAYRVRANSATCPTGPYSSPTTASDAATAPGPATISSITDADGCLASGIRVSYSAGAGATRHDLVRDGTVVVTGYASGTVYVPGDTASHAYVVRAVAGSCTSDSTPQSAADGIDCFCTLAPTFAGLETVVPLSGTTCGLRLSWSAATSSCPNGPAVTYAVYRSTDSGFTPASANLVASCLATTTWDDTSVPSGTTYFYVVRAEDSTAFGTGPCNSGNADANTVRRSGAVTAVNVVANQGSAAIASSGSATAALSPAIGILTPSSASLNYALSYVPAGTSATVVIQPSIADTYVDRAARDTPYGTTETMIVRSANRNARALVQFSLAAIPAGATITAATLELYGTGTVNRSYNVHRITGTWTETGVTWNNQPAITGAADATTATGTTSGWKTWNVRTVVQQWVSGTTNYGLLVKDSVENSNQTRTWTFATRENVTTANRPILRVTYTTSSGSLTANTRVELLDPVGTPCTVKAYGAADPTKPVDVSACYTGPGTYQLRVSENAGGTATLSSGSLLVTGLACVPASAPNPTVLTLRSTFAQNKLEWENPPGGPHGAAMVRFRTDGSYPASPSDGVEATCAVGSPVYDPAGGAYNACLHTGLTNDISYRYTLFLANASGVWSSGKRVAGTPFDHTSGPVRWAYSTGATAMTSPGVRPGAIGTGAIYAVSNDRILHASNPTGAGGDWPRTAPFTWNPVPMNGPVQDRPAPLPLGLGMADVGMIVLAGSQDGWVYAIEAQRGDANPATPDTVDPIWVSAERIGEYVQASPTGVLTKYGSSWDLVFAASRNSASANRVVALNPVVAKPYPGAATTAWSFDNGASTDPAKGIGMVSSSPYPVYGGGVHRLYFTSRKRTGGSSDTVWGLSFTNLAPTKLWSAAVGDTDAAPAVQAGRVYVGTNEGKIYALDAETGAPVWDVAGLPFFSTADGPVKGGLTVVSGSFPRKIYFSTTTTIWCLVDQGTTVTEAWRVTSVPGPSKPVRAIKSGFDRLYVGSSDGSLYELDALQAPPAIQSVTLGAGDAAIGMPTIDAVNELVHVGSESGAFYAARVPLQ